MAYTPYPPVKMGDTVRTLVRKPLEPIGSIGTIEHILIGGPADPSMPTKYRIRFEDLHSYYYSRSEFEHVDEEREELEE